MGGPSASGGTSVTAAATGAAGVVVLYGLCKVACHWLPPQWCRNTSPLLEHSTFFEDSKRKGVLLVAHRAGGGEAPENTLAACKMAFEVGADAIQLDVMLTADGEVVAMHEQPGEDNLLKLTGESRRLEVLDFKQLPPLLPTINGPTFCSQVEITTGNFGPDGQRIATLDDIFTAIGKGRVILELWQDSQELVDKARALIVKHGRVDHTIWGNPFSPSIQAKVHKADPHMAAIVTFPQIMRISLLWLAGLLPFAKIEPWLVYNTPFYTKTDWESPLRQAHMKKNLASNSGAFASLHYYALVAVFKGLFSRPALFAHLQRRGVPVVAFVHNSKDSLLSVVRSAAPTAVQTDMPHAAKEWLRNVHGGATAAGSTILKKD